ncbi:MAG: PD-(D/E)XK nuclease family protein [Oscillospiraceae bacterium]|nr:PD-(D/E)XK nuclease family protein [Oscillospiraceae bacterium]
MLKFVIGTAGTGKSRYITDKIVQLAQQGEKCLLIIPEQFSKTAEAMIFSALDDTQSNSVEVFSFTSLMRDVNTNHIRLITTPLTDAGEAVLARRAVENVKKQLEMYSRQSGNFGFSFNLASTFDDLKRSGITGEIFYSLAQNAPAKSRKLKELALIYAEYCGLMGDKFRDSEDLLIKLAEVLPHNYTHDTHIFIDSFESFSFGQLQIIGRMLTAAKEVCVALTCDSLYDTTNGTGNFSFVQNTAGQLIRLAKKTDTDIEKPVVMLESHRFKNQDIADVDSFLQGGNPESNDNNHVFVTEFENQYNEVAFVAAQINKLVQQGYMYNDIAVVCPQLDKYENQLQESFSLAAIPYFIDTNRIISSCAPVVLFRTILEIMSRGLNSETIMPLLKTGLTNFDDDSISALENYLFVWQDYEFDFSQPFTLSPAGLKPEIDEDELPVVAAIDFIRHSLWDIFAPVWEMKQATAGDLLKKCYETAVTLGSDEKLMAVINSLASEEDRQLLNRQWDTAIECLDQLYEIIGYDIIKAGDIQTLFSLIVEGAEIGFAPQTQDCVIITDPKRMKLDSVKAVFILGAAQDVFPAIVSENGLISTFDREYLKENNYPLKNNFENLFSFENLYYYKALTSPQEYLFISCPKKNIDTRQILSAQVDILRDALNLKECRLTLEDYAITKEFFADYISEQATSATRDSYLQILAEMGISPQFTRHRNFEIKDLELLDSLLGDSITLSPTHVQNYYQCAFMYFIQRILKVKPLEKAEFSARIAGDYLHFIAQTVMEKYGEDYYRAPWVEIQQHIDGAVDKFIKENYPPAVYDDVKFTAQYENMKENATQLLAYIHTEQQESRFRPVAFEEKIGMGGRVPPLRIDADNGKTVKVVGVADRIDIYRGEEKDYLRIIDYKTGRQKFDLDEIYNGLSSQLLLYMNALLQADFGKKDKDLQAGAVVYQPSDAQFKFDKDDEKLYTAVGMALSNPEISAAFDTKQYGRFGIISGDEKLKAGKDSKIVSEKGFEVILDYVKDSLAKMAGEIYAGKFDSLPLESGEGMLPCRFCRFKAVCGNTDRKRPMAKNEFGKMEQEEK